MEPKEPPLDPPLRLYYTRNAHYTTNDASFLQVENNYDFWSAAPYVNPIVDLLQQLLSGLEKFRIIAIY